MSQGRFCSCRANRKMSLRRSWPCCKCSGERGSATIREITDCVYPKGGDSEYATVKKLLGRLETKKVVSRNRSQMVHVFSAVIDRQTLVGRRLLDLTESLCDGSLTPLLTHLAQEDDLSAKQQRMLRKLIDELEQKPPKRKS